MNESVLIAAISFCGTLAGTFGGIMTANKMVNYRLEQLEKKVDKHNHLVERMYNLESEQEVIKEKIKVANNRIEDLENGK